MKLIIDKKYVDELKNKFCQEDSTFSAAYCYTKGMFSLGGVSKAFIIFVNNKQIKLLRLGLLKSEPKEITVYDIDKLKIKFKAGFLYAKLKIITSERKKINIIINKKARGFDEYHQDVFEKLNKLNAK